MGMTTRWAAVESGGETVGVMGGIEMEVAQ